MKSNLFLLPFCTLLLSLASIKGTAQEITFNNVVPQEGDFFRSVGVIAQDKYGYIWISTHNGLFKYDGYRFKHFSHDPNNPNSLASNFGISVCVSRDGNIWIGTGSGLERLDPHTGIFTHFQHDSSSPSSISAGDIEDILEDHEGNLWLATWHGLDRFDYKTRKFIHYRHNSKDSTSLSCNSVHALYEDREGTLWVGTGGLFDDETASPDEGGLNRLDRNTGKFKRFMHDPKDPHTLINNRVSSIYEDSEGVFWVGTVGDGLHTMDRIHGTFQRHAYDPAHPEMLSRPPVGSRIYPTVPDRITFITEDAEGCIWIGTLYSGMNRYDKKTGRVAHYGEKKSASGFTILKPWKAFNSRDEILWIGTIDDGSLYRVNLYYQKIPRIDVADGVYAFLEGPKNAMWLGTNDGGLIRKDRNTGISKTFKYDSRNPKSLSGNMVYSIYKDLSGVMWIGTDSGLNRLNKNDNSFTRYRNNPKDINTMSAGRIRALTGKGKDSLWFGTVENGLDFMKTKTGDVTHFRNDPKDTNSLSASGVRALKIDHLGKLWAGTDGGLDYLINDKAGTFTHFLKDAEINSIYEDSDSTLWVGADNGLYRSNRKDAVSSFVKFTDPGNKTNVDEVYSIQEDNEKNLWVSTELGIYKIELKNYQTTFRSVDHEEHGREGVEFVIHLTLQM